MSEIFGGLKFETRIIISVVSQWTGPPVHWWASPLPPCQWISCICQGSFLLGLPHPPIATKQPSQRPSLRRGSFWFYHTCLSFFSSFFLFHLHLAFFRGQVAVSAFLPHGWSSNQNNTKHFWSEMKMKMCLHVDLHYLRIIRSAKKMFCIFLLVFPSIWTLWVVSFLGCLSAEAFIQRWSGNLWCIPFQTAWCKPGRWTEWLHQVCSEYCHWKGNAFRLFHVSHLIQKGTDIHNFPSISANFCSVSPQFYSAIFASFDLFPQFPHSSSPSWSLLLCFLISPISNFPHFSLYGRCEWVLGIPQMV